MIFCGSSDVGLHQSISVAVDWPHLWESRSLKRYAVDGKRTRNLYRDVQCKCYCPPLPSTVSPLSLRINNKHLVLERLSLDWEEVMLSYQGTRRHRERGGPLVGQRFKSVAVRWWLVPVLRAVESIHRRRFWSLLRSTQTRKTKGRSEWKQEFYCHVTY